MIYMIYMSMKLRLRRTSRQLTKKLWGSLPLRKRRRQQVLFTVALVALVSVLLGRFLIVPNLSILPQPAAWALSGLALFSFAVNLESIWQRIGLTYAFNVMMGQDFPETVSDVRDYGVETPVDFAYMMQLRVKYEPSSLFGFLVTNFECSDDRKLLSKASELFEELFGRKPHGVESEDWNQIAKEETAAYCGKELSEISFQDFENAVSPKVQDNVMKEGFEAYIKRFKKW